MEENLFNKIPGLENILESRSFEELTASEKNKVLGFMTGEEYENLRETMLKSKAMFAAEQKSLTADPAIRKKLLARMEQKGSAVEGARIPVLQSLFAFRIPAYQAVFAIAALVLLFFFLRNEKPEAIRYLTKTDTIYLKQEIAQTEVPSQKTGQTMKTKSVKENKTGGVIRKEHESKTKNQPVIPQNQYVENAYQKIKMVNLLKAGSRASDDSVLMRFLVTAN